MSELQYLEVERHDGVALVRLNRPEVLNALCMGLMQELAQVFGELESDDGIAVIVMTGNDKAFAAGADITEMKDVSYQYMLEDGGLTRHCDTIADFKKPVIAAVAGYALGGGCELAMMCDFIIAADNARFGQPEITIGWSVNPRRWICA
jgi:enoyl-CoA hydratase